MASQELPRCAVCNRKRRDIVLFKGDAQDNETWINQVCQHCDEVVCDECSVEHDAQPGDQNPVSDRRCTICLQQDAIREK